MNDLSAEELAANLSANLNADQKVKDRATAWKVLEARDSIRKMFEEHCSDFLDIQERFDRIQTVFTEFKTSYEQELARKAEAEKQKNIEAIKAMMEAQGLTAEDLGLTTTKKPKQMGTRKKPDQYVIKYVDQQGETQYTQRITGGRVTKDSDLALYLDDTGKKVSDLVIGKVMTGAEDGHYTNEDSQGNVIDSTDLVTYLEIINKADKLVEVKDEQLKVGQAE
ncbi:H-NS histone family protein [Photobacterium swingsii]|uniref:H-NS family histone-like protein n=1 Tax=Photobacterium swingsii TaxID=680026 RepID=UPI003D09A4B4